MSLIGTMYKEPRIFAHHMVALSSLVLTDRIPRVITIIESGSGFAAGPVVFGPSGTGEVVTTNGNGVNIDLSITAVAGSVTVVSVSLGFTYESLIIPDGYAVGDRLEVASPTPGVDAAIFEVTSLYQDGPSFSNGAQAFGQGTWGSYYPIIYKNAPYSQFQKPLVCYGNDCGDIVCAYGSVGLYIGLDGDYTVVDEAGWVVTLMGLKAGTFCPILVVSVTDGPEEYEDSTLVIY